MTTSPAAPVADTYRRRFILVLGVVTVLRMVFLGQLPLSGDETYHWEWSRHLAWGYYDHPGFTAYLIRFCTTVFGDSTVFSIRFGALLMMTGAAWIAFVFARRVTRDRGGDEVAAARAGWWAGLLMLATPIFSFFAVYISTDPPFLFFWTLSLYLFYRALTGSVVGWNNWGWWLGAGAAVGLGLLSKFLAFLLLPALALYVLGSRENRRWLVRPQPYIAALLALAFFSPCLIWNLQNDWATFIFNFVSRQVQNRFSYWHALEFLGVQTLILTPVLALAAVWALVTAWHAWRRDGDRAALYFLLTSGVTLLWFLLVGLQRRVGAHWAAAAWIGALIYLASRWAYDPHVAASAREWRPGLRRWALGTCVAFALTMQCLAAAIMHVPPFWILHSWAYASAPMTIRSDKLSEIYGWPEFGRGTQQLLIEMKLRQASQPRGVFLISQSYATASSASFYTPGHPAVMLFAPPRIHGENYRYWDDFAAHKGQDAIFVSRRNTGRSLTGLRNHFARVDPVEKLSIVRDKQVVRTFEFIRAYDFDGRSWDAEKDETP